MSPVRGGCTIGDGQEDGSVEYRHCKKRNDYVSLYGRYVTEMMRLNSRSSEWERDEEGTDSDNNPQDTENDPRKSGVIVYAIGFE